MLFMGILRTIAMMQADPCNSGEKENKVYHHCMSITKSWIIRGVFSFDAIRETTLNSLQCCIGNFYIKFRIPHIICMHEQHDRNMKNLFVRLLDMKKR